MFSSIFNAFSSLSYYFFVVNDIELEEDDYLEYDIDLESRRKMYLIEPVKYFIWRKSALLCMIPLLILDFSLNIVNYQQDVDSLSNNRTYESMMLEGTSWHNSTEFIIDFLHPKRTRDYWKLYTILSSICLFMELVYACMSLCYHRTWYSSAKWLRYSLFTSIVWIYLIYINPVINYLKLKSSYDNNKSYENQDPLYAYAYIFILGSLLKEVFPIMFSLGDSMLWASVNLKYLFPKNIMLGYIFQYANLIFILTTGFIFLLVNQLFNNYLISLGILCILLSYIIPYYWYRNKMTISFDEDDEIKLRKIVLLRRLILTLLYSLGFLLILAYCLSASNPFKTSIKNNYSIDVLQCIVKLCYRFIFFKLVIADAILNMMLQLEKYRTLYQDNMKIETKKLRDIENQLYIKNFY